MALIGMAVYSTEENKKDECLEKTLQSLYDTVNFSNHRLMLSVNAFTPYTKIIIERYKNIISNVIYNDLNIGTAEAINKVWQHKQPNEHCIKMDDDIVIHQNGWLDLMEEAIQRQPNIGIVGLKRKDCWENPNHLDSQYKSTLTLLPPMGSKWIIAEQCKHIMGTCQMYNSALLDKIGYLYQPGLYGYDDVLASYRSEIAGFINIHLPQIEIDHIDKGDTGFQSWKERHAGTHTQTVINIVDQYINGSKLIYYNPFNEN